MISTGLVLDVDPCLVGLSAYTMSTSVEDIANHFPESLHNGGNQVASCVASCTPVPFVLFRLIVAPSYELNRS
jgi:hypothetical protein